MKKYSKNLLIENKKNFKLDFLINHARQLFRINKKDEIVLSTFVSGNLIVSRCIVVLISILFVNPNESLETNTESEEQSKQIFLHSDAVLNTFSCEKLRVVVHTDQETIK